MKQIIKYAFAIAAILIAASCTKAVQIESYLNLSASSYTFSGTDQSEFEITVYCPYEWTATPKADWIKIDNVTEHYAVIKVDENSEPQMRSAIVEFSCAENGMTVNFTVDQLSKNFKGRFEDLTGYFAAEMSRNGKWVFASRIENIFDASGNGTTIYHIDRINTKTGERTEWLVSDTYGEFGGITDDGNTVIMQNTMGVQCAVYTNGEKVNTNLPENVSLFSIEGISPDGSVMVGYISTIVDNHAMFLPVKWTNGEPEILEVPEINSWGGKLYNGAMARGVSDDGTVIYGSEWDEMGLIYWKDGKMNYLGRQFAEPSDYDKEDVSTLRQFANNSNMSNNGKYIAGYFERLSSSSMTPYPARINTETGNVEIYNTLTNMGKSASNDGLIFCEGGTVIENGEAIGFNDYLNTKFGISLTDYGRTVTGISPDNNAYFGLKAEATNMGVMYKGWYLVIDADKL